MNDTLITFGGVVKALGNGRIGGYLAMYGNAETGDLTPYHDYFTAKTDMRLKVGKEFDTYYAHGLDPIIGKRVIGAGEVKSIDPDAGPWYETQLQLRDEYERYIYKMAEAGKLGFSSGAVGHLVERKAVDGGAHEITLWPVGEVSVTPTPADSRNAVVALKSVHLDSLKDMVEAPVMTFGGQTMAQPTVGNVIRAAMDDALTDIITATLASGVLNDAQYKLLRDGGDAYVDSVLTTLGATADTPAPYGLVEALADDDSDDGWKSVDMSALKAGRKMNKADHAALGDHLDAIGTGLKGAQAIHKKMAVPPETPAKKEIDPEQVAFFTRSLTTNARLSAVLTGD